MVKTSTDLAKIHTLRSLLGEQAGKESELAEQIKRAIDFSLTGSVTGSAPMANFAEAAERLLAKHPAVPRGSRFHHIGFEIRPFDPLWVQDDISRGLKRLAGCPNAVLLVTGLRDSIVPDGKYFTEARQKQYREAVDYIDKLAAKYTTPNMRLNIVYV